MKIRNILLTILTLIMVFVSCVKIDNAGYSNIPTNPKGEYAIVFSNPNIMTKASVASVSGTGYDDFKLFVWNSNQEVIMDPYLVEAVDNQNNYQYESITGQELKYYSNSANYYDFIGVIPTSKTMTRTGESVKVEDVKSFLVDDNRVSGSITADSDEEFLSAYTRVDKANYGSVATIPFKHGNALLYLGFSSDDAATEIIDYVPGTPFTPEVPGTPVTETYTSESVKFIDALVEGKSVQVPIGFVGSSSPKLTATNPTSLYIGTNNATYNYYAKDWLLSIKDAVNATAFCNAILIFIDYISLFR